MKRLLAFSIIGAIFSPEVSSASCASGTRVSRRSRWTPPGQAIRTGTIDPMIFLLGVLGVSLVSFVSLFSRREKQNTIREIQLPPTFERIKVAQNSFEEFCRNLPLKKDKTIYLYNGQPKRWQGDQFAVVDLSIGDKDLQQCADAIMRIRAEYFYSLKQFDQIKFTDNAGKEYKLHEGANRKEFDQYLENVFTHCGTLSLEKQLYKRTNIKDVSIGDIFIKGGSPGHAMMMVDMAVNPKGQKIYLLLQGFMPAQSIHVVKNPEDTNLSPWYLLGDQDSINTPDWTFHASQLKHW